MEKIFEAREVERDASFLRRYLTEDLMREMDIFEYEARGEELVVSKVADDEGWRDVKETLIKSVGTNSIPVLRVEDADFGQNRTLYVKHHHDGRDLHLEYAEKSLTYLQRLWSHEVVLETVLGRKALGAVQQRPGLLSPRAQVASLSSDHLQNQDFRPFAARCFRFGGRIISGTERCGSGRL